MPEAPAKPTAAQQQDELLLLAEKIGEVSDRLAQIETEFTAQTAPLDAARGTQESALAALNAALAGIKALNFHVLDNNLGAVSKRVESHEQLDAAEHRQLAEKVDTLRAAYSRLNTAVDQRFAQLENQRHELSRTQADAVSELRRELSALREDPRFAAFERALSAAVSEFREPRTFNPRGKWDGQTKYARLDIAELNGNSFVSNADDNDEKPDRKSTKWTLLARRGGAALGGGATDITGVAGLGATGLQLAQSGTESEAREILGVEDFTGATADDDGAAGRVPAPSAGDQNKYLRADGTWFTPASVTAPAASQSTVDAGTADDEFVAPLTLHGYVNPLLALRAPRPQAVSNGSTTDRAIRFTPGTRGNLAGATCTRVDLVSVPSSNLATAAYIWVVSYTNSPSTSGPGWSIHAAINTPGGLQITAVATTFYKRLTYANFRSDYSGQTVLLEFFFAGDSTDDPVIRVNGVDVSSKFSETTSGSPTPNWMDANLLGSNWLTAYNWPSGDAPLGCWINAALTDADRTYWLTHGVPPEWVLRGGSMASVSAGSFVSGSTYTITAVGTTDFTLIGAASNTVGLRFTATGVGSGTGTAVLAGALGFPVVGPDRFVRDATRLSPPIDGYMVGMRPLSTDADGWIRGRRTSSGYLQADTQLVGDGRGVVQVLMRSVSGGTVTLGESAGNPATVVASVSLTAGVWTPCTILKSVVSGGKLYAALGTATDVEVAVRTGPILSLA